MSGTSGSIGGSTTWRGLLGDLLTGSDLSSGQTAWAMDRVMAGEVSPVALAAFLVALRAKGESVAELTGLADAMLGHAVQIKLPEQVRLAAVDIVGSGGDRFSTVNISTMAALVVAGTGRTIVKHGNRAASSACGSADVLEALGVRLDLPPARVGEVALEAGITFCFAQVFHPAMRHAAAARRELGVPTAFNYLGPITNPARPGVSAVGVADPLMAPLLAGVFAGRGGRALVFRGEEGLDEISPAGPTRLWRVAGGQVTTAVVAPADVGMETCALADLVGADAAHNAGVVRAVLAGECGPVRDAVLLNAAGALAAAETDDTPESAPFDAVAALRRGLEAAAASIDSGAAAVVLERWVAITRA